MAYVLGLDFGGTKLAAGLVEASTAAVLARATCPTPSGDAEASLAAMLALADGLLWPSAGAMRGEAPPLASPVGVGVSFGGPVYLDGRATRYSMHIPGWEDMPLAERLERHFALPARVANDGDAAALAEHRFGAGRGVSHLIYLTVSTGIGGGLIVDGKLHRGRQGQAGEVGHQILKPDGPPCPCGRNGCLEALASGLSVARDARVRLGAPDATTSVLAALPIDEVSARDVALAAAQGDPVAREVWDAAMEWLGVGVSSACNLLFPGRVVLGGGLTRAGELLFGPVRRVAAYRALDPEVEIVPAALGDDVGIIGGAALVLN
jgi:glucokinase